MVTPNMGLPGRIATVDGQDSACDETRIVRCEEGNRGRNLLWPPDTPDRMAGAEHDQKLIRIAGLGHCTAQHRRIHGSRADAVDTDTVCRVFDGELARHL